MSFSATISGTDATCTVRLVTSTQMRLLVTEWTALDDAPTLAPSHSGDVPSTSDAPVPLRSFGNGATPPLLPAAGPTAPPTNDDPLTPTPTPARRFGAEGKHQAAEPVSTIQYTWTSAVLLIEPVTDCSGGAGVGPAPSSNPFLVASPSASTPSAVASPDGGISPKVMRFAYAMAGVAAFCLIVVVAGCVLVTRRRRRGGQPRRTPRRARFTEGDALEVGGMGERRGMAEAADPRYGGGVIRSATVGSSTQGWVMAPADSAADQPSAWHASLASNRIASIPDLHIHPADPFASALDYGDGGGEVGAAAGQPFADAGARVRLPFLPLPPLVAPVYPQRGSTASGSTDAPSYIPGDEARFTAGTLRPPEWPRDGRLSLTSLARTDASCAATVDSEASSILGAARTGSPPWEDGGPASASSPASAYATSPTSTVRAGDAALLQHQQFIAAQRAMVGQRAAVRVEKAQAVGAARASKRESWRSERSRRSTASEASKGTAASSESTYWRQRA